MEELLTLEIKSKCKALLYLLEDIEQDTTLNEYQERLKEQLKIVINAN